jgi:hypothetical protein
LAEKLVMRPVGALGPCHPSRLASRPTPGGVISPGGAAAAGQPDRCRFDRGAGRAVSGGFGYGEEVSGMVPGGGPPRPASPRGALGSCRSINHCELGARKPYGARLFGVFALVQIGFKFPFGELFGQKMPAVGRRGTRRHDPRPALSGRNRRRLAAKASKPQLRREKEPQKPDITV